MAEWRGRQQPQDSRVMGEADIEPLGGDFEIIVTADEQLPDCGGTLVQAQISNFRPPGAYIWAEQEEEPASEPVEPPSSSRAPTLLENIKPSITCCPVVDWACLRPILRRMSHLVVGGYGGASFLFFGLTFPSTGESSSSNKSENGAESEQNISKIVQKAESEACAPPSRPAEPRRSWWGLITGRHDQEIFERFAQHELESVGERANTAVLGDANLLPRFWVLTDHARKQVVLVLRGKP